MKFKAIGLPSPSEPGHLSRQVEILLFRLHIGHTSLTHSHQMNSEDVPKCVACDCDLTANHILIECEDVAEIIQRYYDAENLQQLFQEISVMYLISSMR